MKHKKLILLGLNEINFDFVNHYIEKDLLPNFKRLFEIQKPIKTKSEEEYKLLEPWIQWVTVHSGKSYSEHGVYRLGDIIENKKIYQIFEELEDLGFSVGAVSPFNADNRLKNPAYFIPDPWTKTKFSGGKIVKSIYIAIHQAVNDNASEKIGIKSLISIGLGFMIYVPIKKWLKYFSHIIKLKKPGTKAIILDSLLADLHISLWKKYTPDFSNLFLNSGAHIQHHYLFNSNAYNGKLKNPSWYCPKDYDPLIRILKEYDNVIGELLNLNDVNIIIATGLHQEPHEQLTFYWRIKEHKKFINLLGIKNFINVLPRMSRDFLINFESPNSAKIAKEILDDLKLYRDNKKIFNVDNRGDSLFVELTYPDEIFENDIIYSTDFDISIVNFKKYISFVAIKNGEHNGIGYLTSNIPLDSKNIIDLTSLKTIIKNLLTNNLDFSI